MNNINKKIPVYQLVVNGEDFHPYPLLTSEETTIDHAKDVSYRHGTVVGVYKAFQHITDDDSDHLDWSLIYEADNGEDVPQGETRGGGY